MAPNFRARVYLTDGTVAEFSYDNVKDFTVETYGAEETLLCTSRGITNGIPMRNVRNWKIQDRR